jgi:hypothetical protein
MKRRNYFQTMAAATRMVAMGMLTTCVLFLTSCSEDGGDNKPDTKVFKEVSGILSGDVRFYADTIYLLKGFVRVGEDDGDNILQTGRLFIDAGTLILGDRETKGTLVVQRGSQIFAIGEPTKPIVFTSERAPGLKQPGDWGGVVICGRATNNIAGGVALLEGSYGAYHGGNDDDDNSGELKYVRIEYAGIAIRENEEVNSLTMGSVGRGTKISYIQCSYGLDDAFEWFGGTVDCSHLVAYRCLDDDWDVDQGYRGRVQFGLSIKDPNLADQSGSNGFEVDGPEGGSGGAGFTAAIFSNITVIGPKGNRETPISLQYQHAAHLRRSNKIQIHNSFFTGFPYGIYIDGAVTVTHAETDLLVMKNNILAAVENWGGSGFGSAGTLYVNATVGTEDVGGEIRGKQHATNPRGTAYRTTSGSFDVQAWFLANNTFLPKWQDAGIDATIFDLGSPKVTPNAGSTLLSGASFTGLTGFENVAYRGAFGSTDWTTGWTNWNPGATTYF